MKVSPLAVGTMTYGSSTDEATAGRIVAKAREQGVNFIDTADAYNTGKSEEIGSIVAFIRASSRDGSQIHGDAKRGDALFWSKANCGSCHAVGLRGTRLGPDLTDLAARRSIPYLRESLLAPGTALTPATEFVAVVEARGFRRASRELFVAQPALSSALHHAFLAAAFVCVAVYGLVVFGIKEVPLRKGFEEVSVAAELGEGGGGGGEPVPATRR